VFPARYELNSYIVFRKRVVSKRLSTINISFSGIRQLSSRLDPVPSRCICGGQSSEAFSCSTAVYPVSVSN
jgi:hypothetical protein